MVQLGTSPFLTETFGPRRRGLATYLSLSPTASDGQGLKTCKSFGKKKEERGHAFAVRFCGMPLLPLLFELVLLLPSKEGNESLFLSILFSIFLLDFFFNCACCQCRKQFDILFFFCPSFFL